MYSIHIRLRHQARTSPTPDYSCCSVVQLKSSYEGPTVAVASIVVQLISTFIDDPHSATPTCSTACRVTVGACSRTNIVSICQFCNEYLNSLETRLAEIIIMIMRAHYFELWF